MPIETIAGGWDHFLLDDDPGAVGSTRLVRQGWRFGRLTPETIIRWRQMIIREPFDAFGACRLL